MSRRPAVRWLPIWFFFWSAAVVAQSGPGSDDGLPDTPTMRLEDLKGGQHSLADYRGKVVLVNFWASWCGPCVTEIPSLRDLYAKMAGEDFEILAVNVKEGPFKVHKFSQMVAMPFPILLDPDEEAFENWGAYVLPTSFLIDSEGQIRRKVVGPLDWATEEVVGEIRAMLPASPVTQKRPSPEKSESVTSDSPAG